MWPPFLTPAGFPDHGEGKYHTFSLGAGLTLNGSQWSMFRAPTTATLIDLDRSRYRIG
jgi:hypothetical protein